MGANPDTVPDEDVAMESVTARELAKAIDGLAARLPVTRTAGEQAVDVHKAKVDAATSEPALIASFPRDYQTDVREYLKGYHSEVVLLANARSSLDKLRKHRQVGSFPVALNSIRNPAIQLSRAYVNAPANEVTRSQYPARIWAPEDKTVERNMVFESFVSASVESLKREILNRWISEKEREITYLETRGNAAMAISALEEVVDKKHGQLKARYDYLVGQPRYYDLMGEVDFAAIISHALAPTAITKLNSLILAEEDKKLETALKKMSIEKPAKEAASTAPSNELSELKKLVVDLGKKVDLQLKKVSDHLYSVLCVCAGHLLLTPPLLESLLTDVVRSGWEEVRGQQEGRREEEEGCHNRKEKGQKAAAAQSAQKASKDKGKGKAKAGGSSKNLPSKGNKKKGGKK